MIEHKGKRRNIHIIMDGNNLFFTGIITSVTKTHISFTDKYQKKFTFRKERVEEISSIPDKK